MAEGQGDWRSEAFRRKVIAQLEEALRSSNTPMVRSSIELENHVFNKAKTREEYLALVARLILYVKDLHNQKRDKEQQQTMQPGAMATGMPPQPMGPSAGIQDPINALQNMAMSGAGMAPVQPQGMMSGAQPMQNLQQQNLQQQNAVRQQMMQQHLQEQRASQLASQAPRPMLTRQDAFIVTSSQSVSTVGTTSQSATPASGLSLTSTPMPHQLGMSGRQTHIASLSGLLNQASPQVGNPPSQGPVPSPVPSSSQPVGSPGMPMMVPSPQTHIVPSPGPRTNMSMGAPSPSTNLNTPGNPGSVGAAPSPASQASEEQVYLDKLKQLSKYIEPLKRMIKKSEDDSRKDTDYKNNINKLKSLLDILTGNPAKRVNMSTLTKCEQVLEKIQFGPKIHASSTPATAANVAAMSMVLPTTLSATHTHMCQPLLDAVAAHITSPTINHTLQRTFGPAVAALYGTPIRAPSPPPKRRKTEDPPRQIPDVLQGEIIRLDRRFKVKLDPNQHWGSKDVHLVCRLDDPHLPSVPPIMVMVPSDYPHNSPECSTSRGDYECTPFLRTIQTALVTHLLDLPSQFSLTALLDMWEMSVRKACMPNP